MPVLPEKRFIVACARLKRLVFAIPQESGLSPAEICKLQSLADVPYDPKAIVSNVAGSVALFPDCFRRFVRVTGWPLHEAIKAAVRLCVLDASLSPCGGRGSCCRCEGAREVF